MLYNVLIYTDASPLTVKGLNVDLHPALTANDEWEFSGGTSYGEYGRWERG